jgi:hypothetical protein
LERRTIFHLLFDIEPSSKAFKVDIPDRSWAFACWEKGIKACCHCIPTEPAPGDFLTLHVIWVKIMQFVVGNGVKDTFHLFILFQVIYLILLLLIFCRCIRGQTE